MSRYVPDHARKGSVEAYEWAEKMRQAQEKKARTKHRVRQAGLKVEEEFFGPGGSLEVKRLRNPGEKWHQGEENVAKRYKQQARDAFEKAFFAGVEAAHHTSASAAHKLHMNPKKKRVKNNPIAIYNPPSCDVCGRKLIKDSGFLSCPVYMKGDDEHTSYSTEQRFPERTERKNAPANVLGTIYNSAIEIRAEKTQGPLRGRYKHVFGKNVKIMGLDNGDVLIHHTGGKKLWTTREDYERSGRKH